MMPRTITLSTIVLVGAALAALTADAKPPQVTAPGGIMLGQTVAEAIGSDGTFFYGSTCYGETGVSGAVFTEDGLAHVMGYVDEKTQTIDAIEVDYVKQVAAADMAACRAEVRRTARAAFPGADWQASSVLTYFLGGADRTHISTRSGGISYEVWGDLEMIVGPVCTVSWRATSGKRIFDARRALVY